MGNTTSRKAPPFRTSVVSRRWCRVLPYIDSTSKQVDPRYWGPDAAEFNPDRFMNDGDTKRHRFAYTPFGGWVFGFFWLTFSKKKCRGPEDVCGIPVGVDAGGCVIGWVVSKIGRV